MRLSQSTTLNSRNAFPGRVVIRSALPFVLLGLAAVSGATAGAAPSDSSSVTFEVVGSPHGGDLHIGVAAPGGLVLPVTAGGQAEGQIAPTGVIDARGGGPRDWSATVGAIGFAPSTSVHYRVESPTDPGTGTLINRMPEWTTVGDPAEALAVNGVSQATAAWTWTPGVRLTHTVGNDSGGSGSIGSLSSGSLGSDSLGSSVPGSTTQNSHRALVTSVA